MVKEKAELELFVLDATSNDVNKLDIISDFINKGLPIEIVTRLESLWDMTKTIADEVVSVGKIIIIKIWEFIKENSNLTIGIAVGVAIGSLINLVPFFGSFLAPICMLIGGIIGGVNGAKLDRIAQGEDISTNNSGIFENSIYIAKKFFELFADIFISLKDYFAK